MSVGPLQILVILLIVLILFGAGKLLRVMGDVAKGIKSFRAGLKEDGSENGGSGGEEQTRPSETNPEASSGPGEKRSEPS